MSKVLVDRELLVRLENAYMEGMSIYGECEEIRAVLAQPAEAEGAIQCPASHPAECYALETHVVHASLVHGIVRQADEHYAALSAVTAERDRLREAVELLSRLRGLINCTPENDVDKVPVWISTKHPTVERIDALLAAMSAKEA